VRTSVGFLSTATALYGRLSAQEMVEYFGRLHGLDEPTLRQRINAIFERLEMNDFANGGAISSPTNEAKGLHSAHFGTRPLGDDFRRGPRWVWT